MTSKESVTTFMRRLGGAASRRVRFAARFATAGRRALPSFLVIGTQRGGTTSLFRYLAGHPQVVAPYRKEVEFFDRNIHRGPRWYRAHFPRREEVLSQEACTFEATANYLFDPAVPSRVSALLPDAAIVVVLREPVERAHSAWRLRTRQGREHRDFATAVAAEMNGAESLLLPAESASYLARGDYAPQLQRWLETFSPDQLLVIRSEDLFGDPVRWWAQLLEHLGLDAWEPEVFEASYATKPSPLEPGLRRDLEEWFRPRMDELYALTGLRW